MELLKKIGKSLLIGTLVGLSITLFTRFFFQDLIDRLEHVTYYMRYRWEHGELSKEKIARLNEKEYGIHIVDIDDRSMQKMGLYWNWDRSYHADMINSLNKHFPAAIVFDILFSGPEDSNHRGRLEKLLLRSKEKDSRIDLPERMQQSIIRTIDYDDKFIEATRQAGCVFHGICLSDENDYRDFALSQVKHKMTLAWHDSLNPASAVTFSAENRRKILERKTIIDGIFPELARAARAIGHVDIVPSEDGVIREVPLFYGFGDFDPVYLPISIRTVASLFATSNEEILFEPGKYIDIGKPFKVFKDENGKLSYSYPNVTSAQIRAIQERSDEILSPKKQTGEAARAIEISSFLAARRDESGAVSIEMNLPGELPPEVTDALLNTDLKAALSLQPGEEFPVAPDIIIKRDSESDWIVTAPYDVEEWWFSRLDIVTLSKLTKEDLEEVKPGRRALIFHNVTIKNREGDLVSSLPCLRGATLRELCTAGWQRLEQMAPGTRMDFGHAVRIPLTPQNRHVITFFGPRARPFPPYSYYDILHNRVQGQLEGKIFVVGSTAPALFDIKAVPHDRSYPAVEIHASLINSFMTDTFIRRLAMWQDFLILLLVGIVIGFISYMLKPLAGSILTVVSIFAYFLVAMTVFGTDHIWIEIARPILTILLTFTAVMAYRYITEEKDRKFLQSTFRHYLSPELIDMMYKTKQVPQLGGEEGIRTAYFTDIQGFSTFSEKLGSPTRLVELLNEYLSVMTDILLRHYGTLDKYEGDAIIAFFGAPMPMDDHAHQACYTALDMQSALGELRKKWISEGDKWPHIVHDMRMRIGVNTGAITTGNMGSAVRMNYTMMGDAVNLAARLESAAKMYGVYSMISHYTHDLVKDDFETRQLDKITVVGKSEPVVVYELMAKKGGLSPDQIKLKEFYNEGLTYFYAQEWDRTIAKMHETEVLEPFREQTPKNMSPSTRIIQYAEDFKINPPVPDWDGVINLTSK